jgi:shikimate kinase
VTGGTPLLVIIGAPGAGKSRIGKRVARLLRCDFVDTDRRIVAKHGPIPVLFAEFGEEYFRTLERTEVAKALQERAVVALGGGAIMNVDTRADLTDLPVALVTVSAEAVESRISGSNRPLLTDGVTSWQRLVDSRREIYESLASRSWDTSGRAAEDVAADIAAWVRSDTSHAHEETRRTPQ